MSNGNDNHQSREEMEVPEHLDLGNPSASIKYCPHCKKSDRLVLQSMLAWNIAIGKVPEGTQVMYFRNEAPAWLPAQSANLFLPGVPQMIPGAMVLSDFCDRCKEYVPIGFVEVMMGVSPQPQPQGPPPPRIHKG